MRIAIGGIEHESSNYSPVQTPLEEFYGHSRSSGTGELLQRSGEVNTIIDGFIRELRRQEVEMVPLVWRHAPSGNQPTRETHQAMKETLLAPLRQALPVDGVLLSLHGAYSAQGIDDADGDILQSVRQLVGPGCPVIAVHDLHCNIGKTMVDNATALIVEDTYPHVDMAERGMEAARMMVRTVRGEIRPTLAWRSIPLFWAAAKMISAEEPMSLIIDRLHDLEKQPGVLTASVGVGYQWADVNCAGASTLVVTDDDPGGARRKADDLARWIWERKEIWQRPPLSPGQALAQGEALGKYPIILADQADNPGGGAPSDGTEILRLFLQRRLQEAAVLYIVDPETVRIALRAGVGKQVDLEVGGKSHPLVGPPVPMRAEVVAVSDGRFVYDGPMFAGLEGDHGDSVLLRQEGVYVAVITLAHQPMDLAFTRELGLDCARMRYLCLKSTGHFRSGFEPIAGSIFNVDASSVFTQDFSKLPFKRLGRKIYPMQPEATFDI